MARAMASSFTLTLTLSLFSLLIFATSAKSDLVRTSCQHANFPNLCVRTLSSYNGPANTPRDLAQAALEVSLSHAKTASTYLETLKGHTGRERSALGDCIDQVGDSIDELRKSLRELQSLHGGTFRWQMSNVQTWVSAALTNDDTCLDGFKEVDGKVRGDVKGKITDVARITSNALYLINRLDRSKPKADSHL